MSDTDQGSKQVERVEIPSYVAALDGAFHEGIDGPAIIA